MAPKRQTGKRGDFREYLYKGTWWIHRVLSLTLLLGSVKRGI